METTDNYFFEPFVGSEYTKGIKGKKVLVLGASFYCLNKTCKFHDECTDSNKKDSSAYNIICPCKDGDELRNQPTDTPNNKTYNTFIKSLQEFVESGVDAWKRVAFTNYVQFFVPTWNTYEYYLSKHDFNAFIQTIKKLKPDVVIVWGTVVNKPIRDNDFVINKQELQNTYGYLWHLEGIPGVKHKITVVNCYHPSSRAWHPNKEDYSYYLKQALM